MISIQLLIIFMILSAVIAVEAKDHFASVIAFGLIGLELSLALLILKAPDAAVLLLTLEMTALAVFAAAVYRRKLKPFLDKDIFSSLTFIAFSALFLIVCARAFIELPAFGSPLMKLADIYSRSALEVTGSANIVAAVIYGFRGLDSLIVIMILFLSAIGLLHVTEKKQ
jgi:multisubunit Na+/H+ antiporter MnhB subunit